MSLRTVFQRTALGSAVGLGALGLTNNTLAQEHLSQSSVLQKAEPSPDLKTIEDLLNNEPFHPRLVRRPPNSPPSFYERVRGIFVGDVEFTSRLDDFKAIIEEMKNDGATREDVEKKILEIANQLKIENSEKADKLTTQIEQEQKFKTTFFLVLLCLVVVGCVYKSWN